VGAWTLYSSKRLKQGVSRSKPDEWTPLRDSWAFLLCAMVVDKQVNSGQEVRIDDFSRCRSSLDVVITTNIRHTFSSGISSGVKIRRT